MKAKIQLPACYKKEAEAYAKDNPINTRQSEFLKMFPNAPR